MNNIFLIQLVKKIKEIIEQGQLIDMNMELNVNIELSEIYVNFK